MATAPAATAARPCATTSSATAPTARTRAPTCRTSRARPARTSTTRPTTTTSSTRRSLSYKFADDRLVYATYSEGFRPGGINRRGTVPPYKPDQLNNYEIGWKTSWLDDRLRINGAVFHQEWQDFQYSILGPNGLTEVGNAGDADIDGIEVDLNWAVTSQLGVSAGVAFLDSELTEPYCAQLGPDGERVNQDPCPYDDGDGGVAFEPAAAPEGTELPVSPELQGQPHHPLPVHARRPGCPCAGRAGVCRRPRVRPAHLRERHRRHAAQLHPGRFHRGRAARATGPWSSSSATRSTRRRSSAASRNAPRAPAAHRPTRSWPRRGWLA